MSRASERNKAVATKWIIEQQLVREGKGTRDWTVDQQRDILERGKAYDDDGKPMPRPLPGENAKEYFNRVGISV